MNYKSMLNSVLSQLRGTSWTPGRTALLKKGQLTFDSIIKMRRWKIAQPEQVIIIK